ncbi:MAG TPA: CGNR zinc finger domain-containing protein [Micromonospora sp.]|nr:MAG: hypothetical protein DIU79_12875 [Actinomycetota bacterium]
MNVDAYARNAVKLVNSPLNDLDDLHALLNETPEQRDTARHTVSDRELTIFRRAQKRLREVFEHSTAGRDADAVAELNALLESFPVQPRITAHDSGGWHLHVTSRSNSVSADYLASAVWGLTVWLCEYGCARLGVCADARCGNVYLDTSSNCCRRFCSERCATRAHVAAHRARKRAAEERNLTSVS